MKRKREMIPGLTLSQNFRLVMTQKGLTFRALARRCKISDDTAYRLGERTPVFVTDQLIKFGKALGFTERQIRDKAAQVRIARKFVYSKKERLYQLVSELIELFYSK